MELLKIFATRPDGPTKCYRTMYIEEELEEKLMAVAVKCNSSFNYVVASMLQYCVDELKKEEEKTK